MITAAQAGSTAKVIPLMERTRLIIRKIPLTAVIGIPARKSFNLFIIIVLLAIGLAVIVHNVL